MLQRSQRCRQDDSDVVYKFSVCSGIYDAFMYGRNPHQLAGTAGFWGSLLSSSSGVAEISKLPEAPGSYLITSQLF